jgi:hypothetical protein
MAIHRQDRAAAAVHTILQSIAEYIATDATLKEYLIGLLADEIFDIERQIAADREGDNA